MEVTNIKLALTNSQYIVANGSIQFDGFLNIEISVNKRKDGGVFVSWPQRSGKDAATGETKYYSQVFFFNKDDKAFSDANKKAIDDLILTHFNESFTVAKDVPVNRENAPAIVVKMKENKAKTPEVVEPQLSQMEQAFDSYFESEED